MQEDATWQRKQRAQESYLVYVQQLHGTLMDQQRRQATLQRQIQRASAAVEAAQQGRQQQRGRGRQLDGKGQAREEGGEVVPGLAPEIEQQVLYQVRAVASSSVPVTFALAASCSP